jgi:hypothetical protein
MLCSISVFNLVIGARVLFTRSETIIASRALQVILMDALVMTSGIEEGGEELSFSPQADVHTADLKHLELSATLRGRLVNEGLGDEVDYA